MIFMSIRQPAVRAVAFARWRVFSPICVNHLFDVISPDIKFEAYRAQNFPELCAYIDSTSSLAHVECNEVEM